MARIASSLATRRLEIAQLRVQADSEPESVARLPADAGAVSRALEVARAFALRSELGSTASDHLAMVVEEWVANIVEHGDPRAGSRIGLRLQRADRLVRLSFSDAGRPFDPREAARAGPNTERGGGAGLALIHSWCRITAYARRAGRNRLVLEMPLA
jgi:serine/threonine-protein kinase RsbW